MAKVSSGVCLYKSVDNQYKVFLVHPGGGFWAKKDLHSWDFPKGEIQDLSIELTEEVLFKNALRELQEETGVQLDFDIIKTNLGSIKRKDGKTIHLFAVEFNKEIGEIKSNTFPNEWPPKSGKFIDIPEVDKGEWFDLETAKVKAFESLGDFFVRFEDKIINS